jgi:hypothetical protein
VLEIEGEAVPGRIACEDDELIIIYVQRALLYRECDPLSYYYAFLTRWPGLSACIYIYRIDR